MTKRERKQGREREEREIDRWRENKGTKIVNKYTNRERERTRRLRENP